MPLVKAEGVILRTGNLGEWDRLVVVLAAGHGKVRVVAKGARKVQSRYASVTQSLTHIGFTAYVGGKLPTLSQAEALESFRPLREDLDSLAYALYMLELVDISLVDGQPHDDILSLLIACLHILSHTEQRELLLAFFELRLLARLGFALGVGEDAGRQLKVSSTAMKLLSKLNGVDWRAVEGLCSPVGGESELAAALDSIVFAKLEKRPESHAFLCAIRAASRDRGGQT